MATTLDDKIHKLTESIDTLTGTLSSMMGENGAMSSSNVNVRLRAEELAMKRMGLEEKLLARKAKDFEKAERERQRQEAFEQSNIGRAKERLDNFKKDWQQSGIAQSFNELKNSLTTIWKTFMDAIGGVDKAAVNAYRSIGMSAASMKSLRQHAVETSNALQTSLGYNTNAAELLELQVAYSKELGRSIKMASDDLANFAAMKQLVGKDQAIKFTANFEKFGLDIQSASDEMVSMFNSATKSGLSFEKLSANIMENLSLAQRYTFKDGIDGLTRMAKQSTAIRWNMQQTATFAEKVGTVEGAVTTSAQMSVLGGEFARFANPMNMLYESLNDMEGLNDRLVKMFSQFATFNERTKQIEVSAFDRMRIKSAAQAMGLDYGQVMDSVFGMGRAKLAEKHLRGSDLNDDYKEFLKNKAQIDRKTGRTYVTMLGEDGKEKRKFLDERFSDEEKKMMDLEMRTKEQDIKSISKAARSIEELLDGIKKGLYDKLAKWIEDFGGPEKVKDFIVEQGKNVINILAALKVLLPIIGVLKALGGTVMSILTFIQLRSIRNSLSGGAGAGAPMMGSPMMGSPMMGSPMMMGAAPMFNPAGMRWAGPNTAYMLPSTLPGRAPLSPMIAHPSLVWSAQNRASFSAARGGLTSVAHTPNPSGGFMNRLMYGNVGGMSAGARMMTGMGLGIAGMGASYLGNHLKEKGHGNWGTAASIGGSALSGAAMLSFLGPWGMLAGGLIGGAVGGIRELTAKHEREAEERRLKERERMLKSIEQKGVMLNGVYSDDELRKISMGGRHIDDALKGFMELNGDGDMIPRLYEKGGFPKHPVYDTFKDGCILNGPSHAHGGVALNEDGDIGQGGEAIIPADQTLKNMSAVKSLIDGTFNQKYTPMIAEKPMGEIMKVSNTNGISQIGNTKIDFSSLNMNMGGTLRLELDGDYKNIDAKKLLNDATFSRTLEGIIREQTAQLGDRNKRFALSRYDNTDPNGRYVRWS